MINFLMIEILLSLAVVGTLKILTPTAVILVIGMALMDLLMTLLRVTSAVATLKILAVLRW